MGRTEFLTRNGYEASLRLAKQKPSPESEMALFHECPPQCAQNELDTADIVREAIFHQLTG